MNARVDEQIAEHLVGQVISSWNAFRYSGPIRIEKAKECYVWDKDGRKLIDWLMGWGSLLLGHTPDFAKIAMEKALVLGFGYQYESSDNILLSKMISEMIPSAEKVRLANSGTEATLHAIRIARGVTKRKKILKFEGHFHGLNDYLLYGVDGSPSLGKMFGTRQIEPIPGSQGLPDETLSNLIIVVPFNDLEAVEAAFNKHKDDIAAIILEPISLNIGCVAPDLGFLQKLREICNIYGALLIFDEVLTGFRVAPGGAQQLFNVIPDLTCLGKALGCGFPAAAVCGKKVYMEMLSPLGQVEMAGTNTGRKLTVIGIIEALKSLKEVNAWEKVNMLTNRFIKEAKIVFEKYGVPVYIEGYGGRIGIHIGATDRPKNFREVTRLWNRKYHVTCYMKALEKQLFGFLLPLGPCPEPVTLSAVHSEIDIDETLGRLEDILVKLPYTIAKKSVV